MVARADVRHDGVFAEQHVAIRANVDVAGIGIARDRGGGAEIRSAVTLVPARPGEFCEIDLIPDHDVFFHRTAFDFFRIDGGDRL